ncbi:MAG: hypothetical protein HFI38_07810 [Lachnospiraceae bacterium]|jgi:ABC-2 type transport system permease protein|nr:hypothetical protein [Lachnospiraceae bacterium]
MVSRKFWLLLKVQLLNTLRLSGLKQKDRRRRAGFAAMGMVYIFLAALIVWYCYTMAVGLKMVGLARLIPLYAVTMGGLATIFFTFLKANGVLFGCRDYDLLMALPVPVSVTITSRFATMYIFNTVCSLGVMAPMGVVYLSGVSEALPWVFWILGAMLASLIPTTLASVAAALVAAVSSRFRYSNIMTVVFSLVLVFGILGLSMKMGMMDESQLNAASIAALGDQIAVLLGRIYLPAAWFGLAVTAHSIQAFAAFAGASIGLYLVFVMILSALYQKIQNGLTAHGTSRGYQVGHLGGRSPLMALYHKEWKGFISSPVYVINMGIGVLMAVAASAVMCFMGQEALLGATNVPGLERYLSRIILYLPAILLSMGNTACVSLSLEGKQLWIIQSLPVSLRDVFLSKILVNLTLSLPGAVVSSVFLWISVRPPVAEALVMFLLAVVAVCFTAVSGVFLNLKFPVYQWENQTQVVKRSTSSVCGIFLGLIVGVVMAFVAVKLSDVPLWAVGGAECILWAAVTVGLWGLLTRVKRL